MPWIDVEGAANMRDLGGTPTEDGGQIAPHRLLRSDNLQDLTQDDVDLLVSDFKVTTIVDLRTTSEVEREGPNPLDATGTVRHTYHPVLPKLASGADEVARALLTEKVAKDTERYPADVTTGHYLGYLDERPEEVVEALRDIATSEGATIVNCAAGKDRTGVIVALALTAAGAVPEAVVADYAASAERIEAIMARLTKREIYTADANVKALSAHAPRPETMKAFLEQLEVRYGGLAKWLAGNGFGADEQARLRAALRDS